MLVRRITFVLTLVLATSLPATIAKSDDPPHREAAGPTTRPRVEVSLDRPQVVVGESARVELTLTNTTDRELRLYNSVGLVVVGVRPDGSTEPVRAPQRLRARPGKVPASRPVIWGPNDFRVVVRVECPFDPAQVEQFKPGLRSTVLTVESWSAGEQRHMSCWLPPWALTPGRCQVQAILMRGDEIVLEREKLTLDVVPIVTPTSAPTPH